MNHIIPTVFAKTQKEFSERFNKLYPISKKIQIDYMDGLFVKSKSPTIPKNLNLKKFKNEFEAHLMYNRPITHIKKLKAKGFKKIIFHLESKSNTLKTIHEIKKEKLSCWLALNPETPVEKLLPYLKSIRGVLLMGVRPGKEHQEFISSVYRKIKTLRKLSPKTKIQVDGGVNPRVAKRLADLGVDYINSGSYISDSENPKDVMQKLNSFF